jgi:hypothetical protein
MVKRNTCQDCQGLRWVFSKWILINFLGPGLDLTLSPVSAKSSPLKDTDKVAIAKKISAEYEVLYKIVYFLIQR